LTLMDLAVGGFAPGSRSELAQSNKFGVAEDAAGGPFGEFDFSFDFGAEPGVLSHFVGGHSLAPWPWPSATA
jgi:hypothetical protein